MAPLSGAPGPRVISVTTPAAALEALEDGCVVAIPTDTVYGLAARLDRPEAVDALFALKDRPEALALPVLLGEVAQVALLASHWPPSATALTSRFWPGPLTVVVPARAEVGPLVGGDGVSVGLRLPRHDFVRALCRGAGPLAVTSANRHGDPPAQEVAQVLATFAGRAPSLAVVVDGGVCDAPASTVADCTMEPPVCRRLGAISWELLEDTLVAGD